MIRFETFASREAERAQERAFVTIGDIVETRRTGAFTTGHFVFYGETAEGSRAKADAWIAAEQKKEADREASKQERAERSRLARVGIGGEA